MSGNSFESSKVLEPLQSQDLNWLFRDGPIPPLPLIPGEPPDALSLAPFESTPIASDRILSDPIISTPIVPVPAALGLLGPALRDVAAAPTPLSTQGSSSGNPTIADQEAGRQSEATGSYCGSRGYSSSVADENSKSTGCTTRDDDEYEVLDRDGDANGNDKADGDCDDDGEDDGDSEEHDDGDASRYEGMEKSEVRRIRNRESSARSYYNKKRRIGNLESDLRGAKRRASELFFVDLGLRRENRQLRRAIQGLPAE